MNKYESFLNNENYKKVSLRPFKYLEPSVHSQALALFIILIPQIVLLAVGESFLSLIIIIASVAASYSAEGIDSILRKRNNFSIITTAVQGIIIGMLLPSTYPPLAVFVISFFTLLVSKNAYGGVANSWVNPIVVTIAIAWIIGMSKFPTFQITFEQLQERNPSAALISDGTFKILSFDKSITSFLNSYVFRFFGVSIPDGYVSLFWDTHSLIPAFRFNLLTIISSIILLSANFINSIIPAVYIFVYSILVLFVAPLFYNGVPGHGDVILALLSSGTLFCTFFLLQWYGTTPLTILGKVFYGFFAGIISFLVSGCGTSPIGSVFTILLINIISPIIQYVEEIISIRYLKKVLLPKVKSLELEND